MPPGDLMGCFCSILKEPDPAPGEHKKGCIMHPVRQRAMRRMGVLLKANMRAAELRDEAMTGSFAGGLPTFAIMKGAPTHSCAHLLTALEEQGYTIMPIPEEERDG